MSIGRGSAFFIWILLLGSSAGQDLNPCALPPSRHTNEVRARDGHRIGPACAGMVLANLAASMLVSGRFAEAERFAERAVSALENIAGSNTPVLLRPLQILATARLEQGAVGKARQAFHRMQLIPAEDPYSRAVVSGLAGILLELEGKSAEAEAEYSEAFTALERAGCGNSADAASMLISLASVYIRDRRWNEAARMLDRALSVFNAAADTAPMDRIKLLNLRAALHARQGDWQNAEEDLHNATLLADQQKGLDSSFHCLLLTNYAYTLRKNHHRREARSVEAHAAALRERRPADNLVDVSELSVLPGGTALK